MASMEGVEDIHGSWLLTFGVTFEVIFICICDFQLEC